MKRRLALVLLLATWCLLPASLQAQGQLIPGNRTISGTFNAGPATGSGNAYVLTLNPALPAYLAHVQLTFRANHTNTGAATLNVNGLGPKGLKKWTGGVLVDLAAGDITNGQEVLVYYDGAVMQVIGGIGGGSGAGSIGAAGTLQAASGTGGFAAYSGSQCPDPTTVQVGLTATGAVICQAPSTPGMQAHFLTDRSEAALPNEVNLGALASGVLVSTVTGGIASMGTVPLPAGTLVGTTESQELDNKRINARPGVIPDSATVTLDLSTVDVAYGGELSQATFFANPTGLAKPGQWLRLQMHSTLPRALTWGTLWGTGVGFPLPTQTSGGGIYDTFLFQYNPLTGLLDLIYNSQLATLAQPTGVTPGTYTCPAVLTVDAYGKVTAITAGPCGGGTGGTGAAGSTGDVQVGGAAGSLASDRGRFTHDVLSHWTTVQQLLAGAGAGAIALSDPHQYRHTLVAPTLTGHRYAYFPDSDGVVPLTTGGATGHLAVYGANGLTLVDGGIPGGGAGGVTTDTAQRTAYYNTTTTVDGAAGLTFTSDGSQVTSEKVRVTALSASATLGGSDGPIVACTTGATDVLLTLPVASTTTQGKWTILKVDTGAGRCLVAPNGSDTLNEQALSVAASLRGQRVDVLLVSATNWSVSLGTTTIDLATQVSGNLDMSHLAGGVGASAATVLYGDGTWRDPSGGTTTLSSSSTFTCPRGGQSSLCEMQNTAAAGTITIAAPTGTPANNDRMIFKFLCTNAQALSWNAIFIASPNIPLPTACPAGTTQWTMAGGLYSTVLNKWQIIATN